MLLPENIPDFVSAFLGDFLGNGIARRVYTLAIDPSYVVKVEDPQDNRDWQNIHEWSVWQSAGRKTSKWLAPCAAISPGGTVLIQRRCEPISIDRLPKMVPSFLGDLKPDNWGWLDGKPVAMDYGRYTLLDEIETSVLKEADWSGYSVGT